jgi:hypothetical protein
MQAGQGVKVMTGVEAGQNRGKAGSLLVLALIPHADLWQVFLVLPKETNLNKRRP